MALSCPSKQCSLSKGSVLPRDEKDTSLAMLSVQSVQSVCHAWPPGWRCPGVHGSQQGHSPLRGACCSHSTSGEMETKQRGSSAATGGVGFQRNSAVQPLHWITALSGQRGLCKLREAMTHACRATQEGQVPVKSSDRTWSPGGGNDTICLILAS